MPLTVQQIADALGADFDGDGGIEIAGVSEPAVAGPDHLALAMEEAFADKLADGQARAAILWPEADWRGFGLNAVIFAPRSRYVLAGVSRVFDPAPAVPEGVHPSSVVEDGAEIGPGAAIGPFVHIRAGARIGAGARIVGHVSVGVDAVIGADALIHPQVFIGDRVRIGDRVVAQPGAIVGGDGFSFVTPKPGAVEEAKATGKITEASRTTGFVRINSMGAVEIGSDVELGAHCCIDRGTVSDTRIGDGTKIDNQVQIGHNVQIGQHCLLCGQVGIAGSTVLGDRVVLAGKVGLADHLKIGSDVIVTAGSGVGTDIASGSVYMGTPAVPRDEAISSYMALRRLPRVLARLRKDQNQVPNPETKG